MAGIGFVLRKLTDRGDLIGIIAGYGHSALASTGPWVFTILSLVGINLLASGRVEPDDLAGFRIIIIYNFAFSLVFSSPVIAVTTRFLSDLIYAKDVSPAPGMMIGALAVLFGAQAVFVVPFYLFYLKADTAVRIAAIANYFLVTGIWLVSVFLSALKEHRAITAAFATGMTIAMFSAASLARTLSVAGMLGGFNFGLMIIFFWLAARVFVEYRYLIEEPFGFLRHFRAHWELAASGLVYGIAIWVDKWILWSSPEASVHANGLISFPDYDSAMFLAYLSIVPSMALFMFSVETEFFEHYLRFYRDVQQHATFRRIQDNHRRIVNSVLTSSRNFLLLQTGCCLMMILLGPKLFALLNVSFVQFGMYRIGVLGALFHVLFLFVGILLSYFDLNRATLKLQCVFLVTNALFTWLTLRLGFPYYGVGYFLAALVTFVCAFVVMARYLNQLPYVSFIRANPSANA